MGTKNRIRKLLRRGVLLIATGALVAMMAACEDLHDASSDLGTITAQASGKFSSGSLSSGSLIGAFGLTGLGSADKEEFKLKMTVTGELFYVCVNNGGNEAPGQFDFILPNELTFTGDDVDGNGRFDATLVAEDPPPSDDDCKKNWSVKVDANDDPITYMKPVSVVATLYQVEGGEDVVSDQLAYTCNLPDPTYPLEDYAGPTDLTGGGYCTL